MYCVQNGIYCGVCEKSYIVNDYANHLKFQGQVNKVLKDHCTNSTIVKTHFIKKMKT